MDAISLCWLVTHSPHPRQVISRVGFLVDESVYLRGFAIFYSRVRIQELRESGVGRPEKASWFLWTLGTIKEEGENDCFRVQELCESRGGRPVLPVPNKPHGFCGRKATLNILFRRVWRRPKPTRTIKKLRPLSESE